MLSPAENALPTQTNAGTPMGELFRRFWLPAMLPCPPASIGYRGGQVIHLDGSSCMA